MHTGIFGKAQIYEPINFARLSSRTSRSRNANEALTLPRVGIAQSDVNEEESRQRAKTGPGFHRDFGAEGGWRNVINTRMEWPIRPLTIATNRPNYNLVNCPRVRNKDIPLATFHSLAL